MKPVILGIAGGTASGKTTVAKRIYENAKVHGNVTMIRLDDYYKRLDHLTLEERKKVNYDHPTSYDVTLLCEHLKMLQNGIAIAKPTYDFVIHNRSEVTELIEPAPVIILEGIMTFAIPEINEMCDIKIYVDTPDDIRFIRRLKRDVRDRGRSVESVIEQYLNTVRPMHLLFVEPSKKFANIIIPEGGHNTAAIDLVSTKIIDLLLKAKEE